VRKWSRGVDRPAAGCQMEKPSSSRAPHASSLVVVAARVKQVRLLVRSRAVVETDARRHAQTARKWASLSDFARP
jgi:hypothetical protein